MEKNTYGIASEFNQAVIKSAGPLDTPENNSSKVSPRKYAKPMALQLIPAILETLEMSMAAQITVLPVLQIFRITGFRSSEPYQRSSPLNMVPVKANRVNSHGSNIPIPLFTNNAIPDNIVITGSAKSAMYFPASDNLSCHNKRV